MKRLLAIVCPLLLATALSSPASGKKHDPPVDSSRVTSPDNHIVPNQRIGAIRLGMGMDEVQSILGRPSSWKYSFQGSKDVSNASSWLYFDLNLEIFFDEGSAPTVNSIQTTGWLRKRITSGDLYWKDILPVKLAFQTPDGITLGSSAFDVRRVYSSYGYEDHQGEYMDYRSLGLFFATTADHIVWKIGISKPQ
jgi:hypothetical protein